MALIDLKTNLKSLQYGGDRPGGGSSGQPFIQTPIPNTKDGTPQNIDSFIRSGQLGAPYYSAIDNKRISKFLKYNPNGQVFIDKQVGLQLSNPKLEVNNTPGGLLNSLLTGDIGPLTGGILEPTRIYNLGVNTLAQVSADAFGEHFERHGLVPIQDDSTKYAAVVKANNQGDQSGNNPTNRLVLLKNKLQINQPLTDTTYSSLNSINIIGSITNAINNTAALLHIPFNLSLNDQTLAIDNYVGGPGSKYGIGNTIINRYDFTGGNLEDSNNPNQVQVSKNYFNTLGVSSQYALGLGTTANSINTGSEALSLVGGINIPYTIPFDQNNLISSDGKSIADNNVIKYSSHIKQYQDLINQLNQQQHQSQYSLNNNLYNYAASTSSFTITSQNNISYKGSNGNTITLKNGSWATLNRDIRIGQYQLNSGSLVDTVNLTPLFYCPAGGGPSHDEVTINTIPYKINDLVPFRIQALDTDHPSQAVWMVFRAFLTDFSDSTNAEWNETKYTGRGEKFYIYQGFTRKIGIKFKVAALSSAEMQPMYQKLNYLMSNVMPDYNNNIMRGPFIKMTVGNWLDGQDGILNSVNYNIPNDSPWEIGLPATGIFGDKEPLQLPHIVEVSLEFTPIGSQTGQTNQVSRKSSTISNIAQSWVGNNGNHQSWITNGSILTGSSKP